MTTLKRLFATIAAGTLFTTACTDEGPRPADPAATPQTRNLYRNMFALIQKGTMIGHQDALAYGTTWFADDNRCDYKDVTGTYPGIFGSELGHLELGNDCSLDNVRFDDIRRYAVKAYELGAVNTISWHVRNPLTGDSAWDVSSKEVVASILPGGQRHELYRSWLIRLGDFLGSIKTADGTPVPIIFRPYHELTGSWFWWGKDLCTPEQYKALWRMTFDYLTHERGLHNLLWAYSLAGFADNAELMERYPGDEYVDILGYDAYQAYDQIETKNMASYLAAQTAILTAAAKASGKLAAITELGYEGVPEKDWYTQLLLPAVAGKGVSYVMLWRNAYNLPGHFYLSYPGHDACDDLRRFTADDRILTNDKLDNIYR